MTALPEPLDLLTHIVRTRGQPPGVLRAPASRAAWAGLADEAHRQGVSGMLAAPLGAVPEVPADVRGAIQRMVRDNALRSLRGVSELLALVSALEAQGVPVVALKGPALSQWLYGSPGIRRFSDLDLLVAIADRERALEVLIACGYALPAGMSVKTARVIYRTLGAWPLRATGRLPVDLHWRLAHARFPALPAADVLAHSAVVELGGRGVRIPCPTHAAVLTLLHAAKHLWCTLEMIAAIAALMERADVDWAEVRRLARSLHAWRGCAAGLRLASDLFDRPMPPALADEPLPAATTTLCEEARAALSLPAGVFQDRWVERRAHRAAFDRAADRALYDVSRLVGPTPLEWEWRPLPDALVSFYVPLRLVRLGLAALGGRLRPARRG